ncbi:MAG TPA: hypothetical protein ENH99_00360 [Candidatus Pacearchaeota archaeon]|nr:hypothetical protein [Candidatus Pacearchaeota archaeon]
MEQKWSKQEKEYIKDNYKYKTQKEIAKELKRSISSIKGTIRRLNLTEPNFWTKEEETYLKENYKKGNMKEIIQVLHRSEYGIIWKTRKLKLKLDTDVFSKRCKKYYVNDKFFDKWSDDMAYILGLICADGNMKKNCRAFIISLNIKDKYILEKALEIMESNNKISIEREMCKISIFSYQMCNELLNLGIVPAKSLILECPSVPKRYIPKFILGVIDGDGSIDKRSGIISIYSGSRKFCEGLSDILTGIKIDNRVGSYQAKNAKRPIYRTRITKKKYIKKLSKMMYFNTEIYMKRKKEILENLNIV